MSRRGRVFWGGVALGGFCLLGWWATLSATDAVPARSLTPGVAYVVEPRPTDRAAVPGDPAPHIDLELGPGERCLLVLGSLGEAVRRHPVALRAAALRRVEPRTLRPFELAAPSHVARPPARRVAARPVTARTSPAERRFALHVGAGPLEDAREYREVVGRLAASGARTEVYLDATCPARSLPAGFVEQLVATLESPAVRKSWERVGEIRDVDGNGRLTVLLTPWLGRLQGGGTTVAGFVRSTDFHPDGTAPFSNRCDMLYLNTVIPPGLDLETLLIHELTHAAHFSQRLPHAGARGLPAEEDWLNEGLAHLVEHGDGARWSNVDYRVARFLHDPSTAPLVVDDYYRAGLWRAHGCRGAVFLFLSACAERTPQDLAATLPAATGHGARNLESVAGVPFADLFRAWCTDLARTGLEPATGPALYARAGRWRLAGPRVDCWDLAHSAYETTLPGTTCRIVALESSRPAAYRLEITGAAEARLQATVIRLPRDFPHVRMTTTSSGVELANAGGAAWTVSHIVWERHDGEDSRQRPLVFTHGLGTRPIAPGETWSGSLDTSSAALLNAGGTIKAVVQDAAARHAAAWLDLPPSPTRTAHRGLK